MHIGIDATALYGDYNGVERALWNLLCALNEIESRNFFSLWIPRDGPKPKELDRFGARWRFHRLGFDGNNKARRIAWQQTQLPQCLKRENCDVLFAPTYVAPLACPIPFVLCVYDLIALYQPHFATRANRLHYRAVLPASLRRAARVVVPSEAVARDVRRYAKTEKIRVVAPGIEDIFFREIPLNEQAAARLKWNLPERYVLFVGNREPKKNLPRLLQALEVLEARREVPPLVIVGEARAWGEELEVPRGVLVRRLGYVPRADLPLLMSGCAAFVFPSLAEGFGLPVLEALACGAPVVASTCVPIANLKNAALLCEAESVESIANAVEQLLANENLANDLSRRARVFAAQFSLARSAQTMLRILEEAK